MFIFSPMLFTVDMLAPLTNNEQDVVCPFVVLNVFVTLTVNDVTESNNALLAGATRSAQKVLLAMKKFEFGIVKLSIEALL